MIVRDWSDLPAGEMTAWYDAERAWWRAVLQWDTADNWPVVEAARTARTLAGRVAYDGPAPAGWSFHLLQRGVLQIGGLRAETAAAAAALLDDVLVSAEAAAAAEAMIFTPATMPDPDALFASRGFDVQTYRYMVRPLDGVVPAGDTGPTFHAGRVGALADLLAAAYPGAVRERPFAAGGTPEEWMDYASRLVAFTACGTILPACSVVEELAGRPGRLAGAVVTTRIAPGSGHLAQVAVLPDQRRHGLARRLVQASLDRLRARGFTQASLLVAERNAAARRLYGSLGFRDEAVFVSAWRDQPRRSTMAACSTGGVSTLR